MADMVRDVRSNLEKSAKRRPVKTIVESAIVASKEAGASAVTINVDGARIFVDFDGKAKAAGGADFTEFGDEA